jgi:threonine/homoserine/homoserine lactone efflux protein
VKFVPFLSKETHPMMEIIAVATITILAVISPGADFAMVTRNSLLHGRTSGLLATGSGCL